MLSICTEPGCTTYVLGVGPCVAHERHAARQFVRGRPYLRRAAETHLQLAARALRPSHGSQLIAAVKR
jgi:hypothetical protein